MVLDLNPYLELMTQMLVLDIDLGQEGMLVNKSEGMLVDKLMVAVDKLDQQRWLVSVGWVSNCFLCCWIYFYFCGWNGPAEPIVESIVYVP